MRRRGALAFLIVATVAVMPSRAAGTLNLSRDLVALGIADQNLVPNQPSLDARPLFSAALSYATSHGISVMTVDPGNYYFLTPIPSATDRYTSLFQVSDLTIDW